MCKKKSNKLNNIDDAFKESVSSIDLIMSDLLEKDKLNETEIRDLLIAKNTKILIKTLAAFDKIIGGDEDTAEQFSGLDGLKVAVDTIKNAAAVIDSMYPEDVENNNILPIMFHESMSKAREIIES